MRIIYVVTIALCLTTAVYAATWQHVTTNPLGTNVYLDESSITFTPENTKTAWIKFELSDAEKEYELKNVSAAKEKKKLKSAIWHRTEQYEYNCKNYTSRIKSSILYDRQGVPLDGYHKDHSSFSPIIPDTIGEVIFKYVCPPKKTAEPPYIMSPDSVTVSIANILNPSANYDLKRKVLDSREDWAVWVDSASIKKKEGSIIFNAKAHPTDLYEYRRYLSTAYRSSPVAGKLALEGQYDIAQFEVKCDKRQYVRRLIAIFDSADNPIYAVSEREMWYGVDLNHWSSKLAKEYCGDTYVESVRAKSKKRLMR